MDSIEDTGDLRTDNTAGGAETTRDWGEYVMSNNLALLLWGLIASFILTPTRRTPKLGAAQENFETKSFPLNYFFVS